MNQKARKILISGSSGLIGSALIPFLTARESMVYRLVRNPSTSAENVIFWKPSQNHAALDQFEGFDTVIHLAGENITGRWTKAKKQRIYNSRVMGTRSLCQALSQLKYPPKTLLCASAIGFYSHRGNEILDETSSPGNDFLANTCQEWESASQIAQQAGIRIVHLRLGVVLTTAGGALAKMLPPFRLGLGGRMGTGNQYMSWISLEDVLGIIHHSMMDESLRGPINVVSPNPVMNREFTQILGKVLHRPTPFPIPAFAIRFLFGEMGEALLLSSTRVLPQRLLDSQYPFHHPHLEIALQDMLGSPNTKRGESREIS